MANYPAIVRRRPEVRDFIRNRRWVHRGDVITYGPGINCPSFSTDGAGFRHSMWQGKDCSVVDCVQSQRYGLVLGPSSVYGFGLAGNEYTIPSVLAQNFGFPFANLGLPEGNSRNLFSLLVAILARAPKAPEIVIHVSGGDFTNFCYTALADPVFGSPNLKQIHQALKERRAPPRPELQVQALLSFSSLWISSIARLCRLNNVRLLLLDDTTFFEKQQPSALDLECGLGKPANAAQERQFATHSTYVEAYSARRLAVASNLSIPITGPGLSNNIGFIDEFHYDREGTAALCQDLSRSIEPLLKDDKKTGKRRLADAKN